jgi:hypothetical protein
MLEHNSTLQVLDLSNNGIGEQDAFILSEALFVNKVIVLQTGTFVCIAFFTTS